MLDIPPSYTSALHGNDNNTWESCGRQLSICSCTSWAIKDAPQRYFAAERMIVTYCGIHRRGGAFLAAGDVSFRWLSGLAQLRCQGTVVLFP